jgi:hypothetical protein
VGFSARGNSGAGSPLAWKKDRSFHWQLARSLGERLPHSVEHLVEREGHYSLPIRHMGEILADLSLA